MLARNALFASCRLFGPPFCDLELLDQLREPRGLLLELALAGLQLARVAGEGLFRRLAFGDVARGAEHDLLLTKRRRGPHQPPQRPVLVEVAVLEGDDLLATLDLLHRFGNRGLAIVGMDEVHEGPRQQLLFAVAENAVPRRIDALEVAVESRDAEHVQREHEETIELLLRAPPVDEQPDLVADAREHREQIRIGLRGSRG